MNLWRVGILRAQTNLVVKVPTQMPFALVWCTGGLISLPSLLSSQWVDVSAGSRLPTNPIALRGLHNTSVKKMTVNGMLIGISICYTWLVVRGVSIKCTWAEKENRNKWQEIWKSRKEKLPCWEKKSDCCFIPLCIVLVFPHLYFSCESKFGGPILLHEGCIKDWTGVEIESIHDQRWSARYTKYNQYASIVQLKTPYMQSMRFNDPNWEPTY